MRKWIENSPVVVGVGLILVGIVFIYISWDRAANLDHIQGQFPYLLSGGILGTIVIAGGLTTILVQTRKQDNEQLVARLDQLIELMRDSAAYPVAGPTAVPEGPVVVAGRSTYHATGCRITEGRDDYRPVSVEHAEARGLEPCRICQPDVATA